MEELLIVNPSRRRKARSPAQRRATAKMLAANRARRAGRASNPKRRHARRRNPIAALANPRRRRARSVVRYSRRRRNPIGGGSNFADMLMQGLKGGLGAIAVDTAVGYLPLPATFATGYAKHAVRVAAAVGLGVFGRRFLGPLARTMASGSLAVTMRDVVKDAAASAGLNLGGMQGMSYTAPAVQYMPALPAPNMGEYTGYDGSGMYDASGSMGMGEYVY